MPVSLALLIFVVVAALAVATYAVLNERRRREIVDRATAEGERARRRPNALIATQPTAPERWRERLEEYMPSDWGSHSKQQEKLLFAGFESPIAPLAFSVVRVVVLVALVLLAVINFPGIGLTSLAWLAAALGAFAWLLPVVFLNRLVNRRQGKIRRAIPDALDLLVVCVEAGISLDAAILRVAKELQLRYPELARELLVVNRKTNAGMPRDEALRGLWTRTGVLELRTLASSLLQSEKWGTSISRVLRVSAETFRRRRRQAAEKRVAMVPVKMTIPLVTLILPALFLVILGPAVLQVIQTLSGVAGQ